ncbi:hypothetical protein D9M69_707640 [compost metagenome]
MVHLVAQTPESVEAVRAAVVPVVEELVHQHAQRRAAGGAESRPVENVQTPEKAAPEVPDEQRQPGVDHSDGQGP